MTNTIFDALSDNISEDKKGFLDIAGKAPMPKDNSFLNQVKDYGKTIVKGAVEGLSRLGTVMGPLQSSRASEEALQRQTEFLNQFLPTEEEFPQTAIRRGLREAPTALAFPGSTVGTLPRAIAAGFLGEGAKELGLPEWAQTAAELTAYLSPSVTKNLLSSGKDKEIIEAGRRFGLSDEQITPLIQSDFKQKWLSKIAPRRGQTEQALKSTKQALSEAYGQLQKSEISTTPISDQSKAKLVEDLGEKLFKMPSKVRSTIKRDAFDLMKRPITGESLINFYVDIGHNLGPKTKQLSLLKQPIKEALQSISPELAKDFELINKLHTKYYPIASKLKPTLTTDIVNAAETIGILGSIVSGYYPSLAILIGEKATKKIAQQMLVNPKFQQLSKKMIVAARQNKFNLGKKILNEFGKELKSLSPETSDKLQNISDKELNEFLSNLRAAEE